MPAFRARVTKLRRRSWNRRPWSPTLRTVRRNGRRRSFQGCPVLGLGKTGAAPMPRGSALSAPASRAVSITSLGASDFVSWGARAMVPLRRSTCSQRRSRTSRLRMPVSNATRLERLPGHFELHGRPREPAALARFACSADSIRSRSSTSAAVGDAGGCRCVSGAAPKQNSPPARPRLRLPGRRSPSAGRPRSAGPRPGVGNAVLAVRR